MARKRMIDPQIWADSKFLQLDAKEKLIFIGCLSWADDEGILEIGSESLWYKMCCAKTITVDEYINALAKLADIGMIIRYDGYAFIPAWFKHQYIKHPTKTILHRPPESIAKYHPEYLSGWHNQYKDEKKYPYGSTGVERG